MMVSSTGTCGDTRFIPEAPIIIHTSGMADNVSPRSVNTGRGRMRVISVGGGFDAVDWVTQCDEGLPIKCPPK